MMFAATNFLRSLMLGRCLSMLSHGPAAGPDVSTSSSAQPSISATYRGQFLFHVILPTMSTVYTPSRRSMMADIHANANPNNPFTSHIVKAGVIAEPESPVSEKITHDHSYTAPSRGKFGALGSTYRSVSWILGFKERFSLVCCMYQPGISLYHWY